MAAKHARSYHYVLSKMTYAIRICIGIKHNRQIPLNQKTISCTHLKLIVRWRRPSLPSFTLLTQNYRVPEHQLLSPYKVHPASHTDTVNCLKMPKFRFTLRGLKIKATVCTLPLTKGDLFSVRYVHFEDSLWSKRSSSPR